MRASKGSAFERDICKQLSNWISTGQQDDIFWRSSQSGGRATTRAKFGKTTEGSAGDIHAVHPDYAWLNKLLCFELKRGYNSATLHELLDSEKAKYLEFISQVEKARLQNDQKISILIHKRDRMKCLIIVPFDFFCKLSVVALPSANIFLDNMKMTVLRFSDFLEHVSPAIFLSELKKLTRKRKT